MVVTLIRKLDGANGRNWPGLVILSPHAPYPAATWAQEAWEAEYKMNPIRLLRVKLDRSVLREMEIMGHEVEAQAAAIVYGRDAERYRTNEARAMIRGYDGLFAGVSAEDLADRMKDCAPEASRWVRRNLDDIRKYRTV